MISAVLGSDQTLVSNKVKLTQTPQRNDRDRRLPVEMDSGGDKRKKAILPDFPSPHLFGFLFVCFCLNLVKI